MKKYLLTMIILLMLLGLVGCGTNYKQSSFNDIAYDIDEEWEEQKLDATDNRIAASVYQVYENDKIIHSIYISKYEDVSEKDLVDGWKNLLDKPHTAAGMTLDVKSVDEWNEGNYKGHAQIGHLKYSDETYEQKYGESSNIEITNKSTDFKTVVFTEKDSLYYVGLTVYNDDVEKGYKSMDIVLKSLKPNDDNL